MGSGLDVKIFLLLQAAGVEQGVASSGWCFLPPLVQSLSDRFLMRQRLPFGIDFYVRQRGANCARKGIIMFDLKELAGLDAICCCLHQVASMGSSMTEQLASQTQPLYYQLTEKRKETTNDE